MYVTVSDLPITDLCIGYYENGAIKLTEFGDV